MTRTHTVFLALALGAALPVAGEDRTPPRAWPARAREQHQRFLAAVGSGSLGFATGTPSRFDARLGLAEGEAFQVSHVASLASSVEHSWRVSLVTATPAAIGSLAQALPAKSPRIMPATRLDRLTRQLDLDPYDSFFVWQPPPYLPQGLVFFQNVPPQEVERVKQALARAMSSRERPAPEPAVEASAGMTAVLGGEEPKRHEVAPGETLYAIAKQHGVTTTALAAANGIAPGQTRIVAGRSLTIPAAGPRLDRVLVKEGKRLHWIQEGDTPAKLARLYGISAAELRAANPEAPFRAGGLLALPEKAVVPASVTVVE